MKTTWNLFPRLWLALMCCAVQPGGVAAEARQGHPLTVAYRAALLNDPELQASQTRILALRAASTAAASLTPETPSLEASYRTDRNHANLGTRETEVGLSVPVWLWGERRGKQNLAQAEMEASEINLSVLRLELAGKVRSSFWNLQAARIEMEQAHGRLRFAQQLKQDVEKRVAAGELAPVDLLQAQAAMAEAEAGKGLTQARLAGARLEFSEVTGLPGDLGAEPGDSVVNPLDAGPVELQEMDAAEVSGSKTQTHPLLQQAHIRLKLARYFRELAAIQSRANPEISLALVNERNALDATGEKSLRLGTRIPLGADSLHSSRVLNAQAEEMAAEAGLRRLEMNLKTRAATAAAGTTLARDLKKLAEDRARASREIAELVEKSFRLGETGLPALLRVREQAFEAEGLYHKALIEHAARISEYLQTLGLLPENTP